MCRCNSFPLVFALTAATVAPAQTCSTGVDGPLVVGSNVTLPIPESGEFHFTTITINPGATLRFTPNSANTPPKLFATGDVQIHGAIQISAIGAAGGVGAGSGGANGVGLQAGVNGTGLSPGFGGATNERPGNAGGGAGCAVAGLTAIRWTGPAPATGGAAMSFPSPLAGGSGGGGGSGWVFFGVQLSGGPGGGGGGGIHICSAGTITISGAILANGASGGTAFANIGGHGGPGGGGSGGCVDLIADQIVLTSTASIACAGQPGGGISTLPIWDPNFSSGANGGDGYIRLQAHSIDIDGALTGVSIIADLCTGDFDNDGAVTISDLAILLGHFGLSSGVGLDDGDTDGDGDVDISDLARLLGNFGASCE